MVLLNIMSFSPSFDSNVPVGVLCSDVPTPGRLQSLHQGLGTAEGFLALDIIVDPLCYKEDTLLYNLILRHPLLMALSEKSILL